MRLDQLTTFRSVADDRSYTRAAERLFMTQSAVYQQVRHLEQEVGEKLCYVLGKEVLLTSAGRALYDFAVSVAEQHEVLQRRLRQLHEDGGAVVRIGSAGYFGLLPAATERIATRHPGIRVEFRSVRPLEAVERIRTGELDFGFFGRAYVPADLSAEPWTEQRIVVAAPAGHELAERETVSFADVAEYPLVGYIGGSAKSAVDEWVRAHAGVPVRFAAAGDTSEGIRAMALSMHTAALVAEAAIHDEVQSGRMKILRVDDFAVSYTLCIVHRGRETLSPAALEYLSEALALGDYAHSAG